MCINESPGAFPKFFLFSWYFFLSVFFVTFQTKNSRSLAHKLSRKMCESHGFSWKKKKVAYLCQSLIWEKKKTTAHESHLNG